MASLELVELASRITGLSPQDQLRLAADLMEAQQADTAYVIIERVKTGLGAALAMRNLHDAGRIDTSRERKQP